MRYWPSTAKSVSPPAPRSGGDPMAITFRKSFSILPGVRLNLNRRSWSVIVGPKNGPHHTWSSTGRDTISSDLPDHSGTARPADVDNSPPSAGLGEDAPMHATANPAPEFLTQSPQARRRIPLGELASRGSAAASPALARVMPAAASAGRVAVAAFQSFSR